MVKSAIGWGRPDNKRVSATGMIALDQVRHITITNQRTAAAATDSRRNLSRYNVGFHITPVSSFIHCLQVFSPIK